MKSQTRSPAIRRAVERARAIGYTVEFVEFAPDGRAPCLIMPAGLCDQTNRRIRVSMAVVRDMAAQDGDDNIRGRVAAIVEHELEHAMGAERGTDHPEFGLRCGGTQRININRAEEQPA